MKKLEMLLAIFLSIHMQTFAMDTEEKIDFEDQALKLSTNLCTIFRTSALEKARDIASCSEEQKEALAAQAMQVFTNNIPLLMQSVPSERQNEFTDQVTDLMQKAANAYPAQMSVQFIVDGITALSALDEAAFVQRIKETKSAIQTAINTIQPPRDLRFVSHTLCAKIGFVGSGI